LFSFVLFKTLRVFFWIFPVQQGQLRIADETLVVLAAMFAKPIAFELDDWIEFIPGHLETDVSTPSYVLIADAIGSIRRRLSSVSFKTSLLIDLTTMFWILWLALLLLANLWAFVPLVLLIGAGFGPLLPIAAAKLVYFGTIGFYSFIVTVVGLFPELVDSTSWLISVHASAESRAALKHHLHEQFDLALKNNWASRQSSVRVLRGRIDYDTIELGVASEQDVLTFYILSLYQPSLAPFLWFGFATFMAFISWAIPAFARATSRSFRITLAFLRVWVIMVWVVMLASPSTIKGLETIVDGVASFWPAVSVVMRLGRDLLTLFRFIIGLIGLKLANLLLYLLIWIRKYEGSSKGWGLTKPKVTRLWKRSVLQAQEVLADWELPSFICNCLINLMP